MKNSILDRAVRSLFPRSRFELCNGLRDLRLGLNGATTVDDRSVTKMTLDFATADELRLVVGDTIPTATLNGANTFTGGTVMTAGTILLGNDKALGTWTAGNPATETSGRVLATDGDSTIKVDANRTITNHFQIGTPTDRTGSLTFDIASGTTLTIDGVENTSSDPYLGSGGAINVNVPSRGGTTSPLRFIGGGRLVLSNNQRNCNKITFTKSPK